MSLERTEGSPDSPISGNRPPYPGAQTSKPRNTAEAQGTSRDAARNDDAAGSDRTPGEAPRQQDVKSKPKEFSQIKLEMEVRLPALADDADVGVEKEQIVTRDGKADLGFSGVLLVSAAPACASNGHWKEYRIYQTNSGKHVFSRVTRTVFVDEQDGHDADVFDPAPSSVPSQLLRSAREMARSRPLTWMDAAVAFFGYDPLAKTLYRKLSVRFEERI